MPKPYTILRTEENFKLYNYIEWILSVRFLITVLFENSRNDLHATYLDFCWHEYLENHWKNKLSTHIQCPCLVFIIVEIKEQMILKMTWKGKGPETCVLLYPSLFPDTNSDTNLALSEGRPESGLVCIHTY